MRFPFPQPAGSGRWVLLLSREDQPAIPQSPLSGAPDLHSEQVKATNGGASTVPRYGTLRKHFISSRAVSLRPHEIR